MNELLSMVVPLETLPGWPNVQEPSVLQVLGLLVGAPLLLVLFVAVITRVHHAVKGNVGTPAVTNQPVWVNGRRIESASQSEKTDSGQESMAAGQEAVTARRAREDDAADEDDSDRDRGGAGARW